MGCLGIIPTVAGGTHPAHAYSKENTYESLDYFWYLRSDAHRLYEC